MKVVHEIPSPLHSELEVHWPDGENIENGGYPYGARIHLYDDDRKVQEFRLTSIELHQLHRALIEDTAPTWVDAYVEDHWRPLFVMRNFPPRT